MKLNPHQVPLYGSCVLTIQLSNEELSVAGGIQEDVELFLVFIGSTQRHLSSTLRASHDTLLAVCPAHDCCESVVVTVCSADPDGLVHQLASERMCFIQDLAFDMAQFLVGTVGRAHILEGALLLDDHQIPLQECEKMDQNLARALSHLTLPLGWSILGNHSAPEPQETLLHLAARCGLQRVAQFLLKQPGAQQALALPNKQGDTPASLANIHGHSAMLELLKQEEMSTQDRTETHRPISSGESEVQHHPSLNTYTLALDTQSGSVPYSLQADLQDFRCLIHHVGGAILQLKSESFYTAGECAHNPQMRQTCFEQPQHSSLSTKEQESTFVHVKGNKTGQSDCCCPGPLQCSECDSDPTPPSDNSNRDKKWVCTCENTEADYTVQAARRKEGDSGDCLQSEVGRESAAHQTLSCGNEGEETDRAQELICEVQDTAEGPKREVHAKMCSVVRPDQDQLQQEKLLEHKTVTAADRRITQSLHTPESSDVESCSQEADSNKEKEVDKKSVSSSKMEEIIKGICKEPEALDGVFITACEKYIPPAADTLHALEDKLNVRQVCCEQTTDIHELGTDKQEEPGQGNTKFYEGLQEVTSSIFCFNLEREISQDQSAANILDEGTDDTTHISCQENETPEKIQALSNTENNEDERICNYGLVDCPSLLRMDKISEDTFNLHKLGTDSEQPVTSDEPYQQEASEMKKGNESQGQRILNDFSQPQIDSEPESPTPSSEDTLEPEDTDCCITELAQGLSGKDQQESPETGTPKDALSMLACQDIEVTLPEDKVTKDSVERHDIFEGQQKTDYITLQSGIFQQTQEMDLHSPEDSGSFSVVGTVFQTSTDKSEEAVELGETGTDENSNDELPNQGDGTLSQNSFIFQSGERKELSETTITEKIIRELCSDQSNCGAVLSTSSATDIIDVSLTLEEDSSGTDLKSEVCSKPLVVGIDSVNVDLTEAQEMNETQTELHEDTDASSLQKDVTDGSLEDQVDYQAMICHKINTHNEVSMIHRERDPLCLDNSQGSMYNNTIEKRQSSESTESQRSQSRHSTASTTLRDSGIDTIGFISTYTGKDIFKKEEEVLSPGDSTSEVSVSCSSTDDTASLGHPSSSAESSEEVQRGGIGGAVGEAEEEAKDQLTEVPLRSLLFGSTVLSLSPFRRHSWGPGKNQETEGKMNQRSSLRGTGEHKPVFHRRSYSLEGLVADDGKGWRPQGGGTSQSLQMVHSQQSADRSLQVSLNEGVESDLGDHSCLDSQKSKKYRPMRRSSPSMTLPLRQSVSMLSISQRDIDAVGRIRRKRRISFAFNISPMHQKYKTDFAVSSSSSDDEDSISLRSFSSTSSSLGYSITEEEPSPLRGDFEGKSGTKMSRTFSYLKNKMYKKTREKDKEKKGEKDAKDKEKKSVNGHLFGSMTYVHSALCQHCNKALNAKDAVCCTSCSVCVHKSCKDNIPICTKAKFQKQQLVIPESTIMPGVTLRAKTTVSRERPWSAILSPDDHMLSAPRRHTSIMPFNSSNLSKSMSISNIAVLDEMSIKGLKYLSQSTDSLHKANKVNESTESLIDEGTEMIDGQLMGEFEADAKELEADSWSFTMDKKYLKQLKKDIIKRQDVIYELIQTEMHHMRTLRIMLDVYSKGLMKEVQLEAQTVEKVFPMLEDLLELHTFFLSSLLERKKEAKQEDTDGGFVINRVGDILVNQFSGSRGESMKKVYGKYCSRHNEAVHFYKELHAKDKRFQAFIKKKMSSSIVRRLGIPECILLVTQRITKYPVLMQRILQHTKENEEDYEDLSQALQLVKEVIAAVDSKVNEHEKKRRLKEIYSRTDGKSIMRMKSGQMFAREDLIRGRKLLHDGPLQLKNTAGRLKDVQALLLSDVLVFLQEKDQKYVFASLDQRATVITLQKLIVREVANEDRGLFLITAGIEQPEMVEVHASSREERNTWMQLIQDAMHSIEKDDDEGIPSETEEDKKLLESKAKEMRDMLQRKDDQILSLLQEKMKLFHDMCNCTSPNEKMLFRASNDSMPKGQSIMRDAIKEVEMLQTLINSSLGGAVGQQVVSTPGSTVCLPRRAETFGGFDSHQVNISKHGDKEENEDLRRTESDSVLKKGGNTNLLLLLKRNSEQVLDSVTHLHDLLSSLQAVVVQQDTVIEEQRQALSERSSSRPSSRPSSLVEQEKQRSLERHRQDTAVLQRQQAAHAEERRRREREWVAREKEMMDWESLFNAKEEEAQRRRKELEEVRKELQGRKEDYQKDLERLRDSQRKLEREKEQRQREVEKLEYVRETEKRVNRTPSSTSEDSLNIQSSSSVERDLGEAELSASPRKSSLTRIDSKHKGRNLNPFFLGSKVSTDGQKQVQNRMLQLAKPKKDKKKKKSKSRPSQEAESHLLPLTEPPQDGEIFFC